MGEATKKVLSALCFVMGVVIYVMTDNFLILTIAVLLGIFIQPKEK